MGRRPWLNIILAAAAATALTMFLLVLMTHSPVSAAGGETFTVDSVGDDPDATHGDCQCRTSGGVCTLRAAIQEANACSGPQTIRFGGPWLITPATPLPAITDDRTVIDGSEWWMVGGGLGGYPAVWLDGNGHAFSGLVITASNCAIYGLVIKSFGYHGIHLYGGAQNNAIGGTGTHQRNIISGNGQDGVLIQGETTTTNTVAANYIGTNPEGTAEPFGTTDWSNGWHGVSVWYGTGNVISGNLIADNGWSGVAADGVDVKTEIRNNRIGLSVDGQPLGNGFYGIHLAHGSGPAVISNTIAFNKRGIYVEGGSNPWISQNLIYGHDASASSLSFPRCGGGILCYGASPIIASNVITNNVAYSGTTLTGFGGAIAMGECGGSVISGNQILSNTANTAGNGHGGGIYLYESDVVVGANTVMSNTSGNHVDSRGGGLALDHSDALVAGNTIRRNFASADGQGRGGGLWLFYSNATVDSNVIVGNHAAGGSGGGLEIENSAFFTVTNNMIARNSGDGVNVWVTVSSRGRVIYNTIAQNGSSGVDLFQNSTLTLTNNIIVSHTTGIHATPDNGNVVLADYTLFYGNTSDTAGSVITSTHAVAGRDPLFVDTVGWDYHLRGGSPAVNAGIAVPWPTWDVDDDPRPFGAGYDIGADEYVAWIHLPLVLRNY
jgi:CSLREA domain-containing protein